MFACLLAGCGKEPGNRTSLTMVHAWGGMEADHVAMRKIYEEFQIKNPDIELRLISMPTRDEMLRKVEDMIMVGNIPDIVDFGGMGYNQTYDFMVENDMLVDLTPYLQEDGELLSDMAETNLEYWTTKENKLYNVAAVLSLSGGYWYNEAIMEEAGIAELPKTWDEFFAMCAALKQWSENTGTGVKAFQASSEGYLYFLDHILACNGGESEKAIQSHSIVINDEELGKALEYLKQLYKFSSPDEEDYSYRDETSQFNEGKVALYINGVWGAPMISDKIHAKYGLLPNASGTSMSCESACMGYVLGKNADGKEEAAVKFLKYMLSEEVQIRIMEDTEQMPANPGITLDKYKNDKPRMYQAARLVLDADKKIDVPDNLWSLNQKEYFTQNIMEVLEGRTDGQNLINDMRSDGKKPT